MSRLDRLVVLLETGSTVFIRNTAADQLSDLAKGHPEDAINLLGRVFPYLKSEKWETRIAAARAFGGIVNHCDTWDPNDSDVMKRESEFHDMEMNDPTVKIEDDSERIKQEQDEELQKFDDNLSNLVDFRSWDLHAILKSGHKLLSLSASDSGVDIEIEDFESDNLLLKKIKRARIKPEPTVESRSLLVAPASLGHTVDNIKSETESVKTETVSPTPPPMSAAASARLKAMQKRRAKVNAKSSSGRIKPVDLSQSSMSRKLAEDPDTTDDAVPEPQFDLTSQQGGLKLVMETKDSELSPLLSQQAKVSGLVWQFQGVYELLLGDLFDPKWESRHGAALGLRELMKKHGKGAGRLAKKLRADNDRNNSATLEDLAVRLCTLFALDRFGDYVSDTVIAPVRESAAQTLAALLIHLDEPIVLKTFDSLYDLVLQPFADSLNLPKCWEAKHGGMLGLRYFVSVKPEIFLSRPDLLDKVIDMVLFGLKESDDDVQAVAALTLTPIASEFVETKSALVHTLLSVIWDCLTNLRDDLSASIGAVMDLLARLCTHTQIIDIMQKDAAQDKEKAFENLVPRLFPFLRHSITNVRKAVLRTILEFLNIEGPKVWIDAKTLRLIFQNLLVEQNREVLDLSMKVFKTTLDVLSSLQPSKITAIFLNHYQPLLSLLMTPIGIARHNYNMNTDLIMRPSGHTLDASEIIDVDSKRGRKRKQEEKNKLDIPTDDLRVNIDAPIIKGDVMLLGYESFIRTRAASSNAFGLLMSYVEDDDLLLELKDVICGHLKSPHATPRLLGAMIIQEYADAALQRNVDAHEILQLYSSALMEMLSSLVDLPYFRELVPTLKSVRTSCLQLFDTFVTLGKVSQSKLPQLPVLVQGEVDAGPGAFGIENAEKLINETYEKLTKSMLANNRLAANLALEDSKHRVQVAIDEAKMARSNRNVSILSAYSASVLAATGIPKKLNPIIRSLMDSIKQEESETLQRRAAASVSVLVKQLNEGGKKNASDKIVKNLCAFLCVDTSEIPEVQHNVKFKTNILSLMKEEAKTDPVDIAAHERAVQEARIKRTGAMLAMEALINLYSTALFDEVPKLKELMLDPIALLENTTGDALIEDQQKGQVVIDALGILRALLPKLDPSLHDQVLECVPYLKPGLCSAYSVFRYSSAKALATICSVCPTKAFTFLVKSVLPMVNSSGVTEERQGAIESIYHVSATMGADILPYIVFLIVPVLGRMSDSDHDVRVLATTTFASIIKLVPLEAGIPDPEGMPQELLEGRDKEREFIQQMMDPSKIKPFDLPVSIKATLRKYQQEGVNWLAFLNKYHLHGILCDDMGLGKTLQTLCIVASDHYLRAEKFKETNSPEFRKLASIIICPPSLTGHWEQEILQYSPFLKPLVYAGGPSARAAIRSQISSADIVITSYDVCRNDIDHLLAHDFNYCVLDEGHIIKNSSSKLTKSVKQVRAEHRLILSGTPIQNNVLELWSLFDFLMPGFLGTEKVFHEKFAKPIAASRNSKTSSKEQEAGALALESLHKQVLPFMLRRLKEDVLSDLPPKIIQDYYCELSELQKTLYKDFAQKQKNTVQEEINHRLDGKEGGESNTHVFQALQYMRKLCNHPALVVSPEHPKFNEVNEYLRINKSDIRSINHAPKLLSLRTLLLECGIGVDDSDYIGKGKNKKLQQQITAEGVISDHRALIFCQLKDMLDIVENELLKKHLPSVTYMRLDGSTDPRDRQSIVRKFNEDPSIDVLLLTTKVGGLGLNLTGADTVIFVEHDWNPMNDLQAMDRAHRLGQKKVVNVYRLITKHTLEEKIMGLQKFKMNIASTVVNQQNSGLASMDTNQLLDLFDVDEAAAKSTNENSVPERENYVPEDVKSGLSGKEAGAVGELGDLWDEQQYEDEYNLDNFIKTLK